MSNAANENSARAEAIASQFLRARLAGEALREYPQSVPADLPFAYRVQDQAIDRWPDRVAGWKVARIADAWRTRYAEERLVGPVFATNVHPVVGDEVIECPVFDGGFAALEAELVIVVGTDAPPERTQWSTDDAAAYVGSLHVGAEIASSPLATLNDLGPGAVVSDFGNNWGVIVGAQIPDWQAREGIEARVLIEDREVGRASASFSGAVSALAFALSKCAQRGRPLRAGAVISTGAITGVHDIRVGEHARVLFEGVAEMRCCATRAQPHPSRVA